MARLALLTIAVLVLLAAPASAATVRLSEIFVPDDEEFYDREDDSYRYSALRFEAGPGERNRLSIKRVKGGILFRDAGARVKPRRGCRKAGRRAAICRRGVDLRRITVLLGGGNDRLSVSSRIGATIKAQGGRGADRMTAGAGRAIFSGEAGGDRLTGGTRTDVLAGGDGTDRLMGGRGDDELHGGGARDRLLGGRGSDVLRPADGANDRVDGGTGRDTADYGASKSGVTLTPQGGGAGTERDTFSSIENLGGSDDDDVLTGDDGPNWINGNAGHDRIDARGGDDEIDVRYGHATSGSVDATCGDGADDVLAYTGNDRALIRSDCEKLHYPSSALRFDPRPGPPAGRTVQLSLPCATQYDNPASRVVTLRTAAEGRRWFDAGPFDAELATGTLPQGSGGFCVTAVELNDAGAELLQARGELPVVVRVGDRYFTPYAVVLRAT